MGGLNEAANGAIVEPDEVERLRALTWRLLARLLAAPPDGPTLEAVGRLGEPGSELGEALLALAAAAREADPDRASGEYHDLFIGVGRGELVPYASFYRTGFLNERPLAELRADLARLGIARAAGNPEPEDHAAALCEVMAGLIEGRFAANRGADRPFFERHLEPWIGRFFADLERAQAARFYRPVGRVGRLFVEIERAGFRLAA
jgi:TorA maturation chaperone TorD